MSRGPGARTGVEGEERERRPLGRSVAVGLVAGVVGFSIGMLLVAAPLFGLARALEAGRGMGRPFIRDNLLQLVLPVGAVLGVTVGTLTGRWYRRGGTLPDGAEE
jgi:hypothetical protein